MGSMQMKPCLIIALGDLKRQAMFPKAGQNTTGAVMVQFHIVLSVNP